MSSVLSVEKENINRLEIIIGCMYAGKSTEMIRRYYRYKILGNNIGKRNQSQSITIEIIQAANFAALPIFHFIMLSTLEGYRPKSRSVILISNLL